MMIVQHQASSRPDRTVFLAIPDRCIDSTHLIPHIPSHVLHVSSLSIIRPTPSKNGIGDYPTPGRPGGWSSTHTVTGPRWLICIAAGGLCGWPLP